MGKKVLHQTESVCPVCLKKIPASHVENKGDVYLEKECSEHGAFSTVLWRGGFELQYHTWFKDKDPIRPSFKNRDIERGCPFDCGLCADHRQNTCCILLEVTERCNLHCAFCFAQSGGHKTDPTYETINGWLEGLASDGKPYIQLSGGEPTVRDDLPEIIKRARQLGFPYVQLNSNGLRLALEKNYAKKLKEAGLSSVFMQFDGTKDDIYQKLRGRKLLDLKKSAIENCGDALLGVVLVPTVVPGVNDKNLGEMIKFGLERAPNVRGIHFQPVSYFGRYPEAPSDEQRITLPEVLSAMEKQTQGMIQIENFVPSGCDHARCGFHGDFVVMPKSVPKALTRKKEPSACCNSMGLSAVEKSQNFLSRRWERKNLAKSEDSLEENTDYDDLDTFVERVRSHGFTITGMSFQDCWNLDLERLRECSLHVLSPDGDRIPFCAFNLSNMEGKGLYRGREKK
ncbi:MAG: radical SAM protein [Eubacteriaceae bacterium]|nr:radical SAM protein [Eubacteriaceae bacterium]